MPDGAEIEPFFVGELTKSIIDIDVGSFTQQAPDTATVAATVGGKPGTLVLKRTLDQRWVLVATIEFAR